MIRNQTKNEWIECGMKSMNELAGKLRKKSGIAQAEWSARRQSWNE